MKRITLCMTMVLGSILISYSQYHMELGFSRNSRQGNFRSESDEVGVGVSIELKYALSEKLDLGLHLGINGFDRDGFTSILPPGLIVFQERK